MQDLIDVSRKLKKLDDEQDLIEVRLLEIKKQKNKYLKILRKYAFTPRSPNH